MTGPRAYLLLPCLLALAGTGPGHAADPVTPAEARERWLRGNYEEARADYEALAKEPAHKAAAAVGLSRVLQSQGQYEQALAAVEAGLAGAPKDATVLARKADLLYFLGRWDDALRSAETALTAQKNNFLARWTRLRV